MQEQEQPSLPPTKPTDGGPVAVAVGIPVQPQLVAGDSEIVHLRLNVMEQDSMHARSLKGTLQPDARCMPPA